MPSFLSVARRLADATFAVLLAAVPITVWVPQRFPSQDGPQHIENIVVWQHLGGGGPIDQYFHSHSYVAPYWSTQLVLRGLLAVVSPAVADKILVTLLIVALACALRYALVSLDRERGSVLAILALPLATSWFLHMGFYGFVASIAVALLAAGFWIRHGEQPQPAHVAALGAIFLLAYASHLIGALLALVFVAAITFARRTRTFRAPLLAAAPTLLLIVGYLATSDGGSLFNFGGLRPLIHAVGFDPLVASFRAPERVVSALLAVVVWLGVGWALWVRREQRFNDLRWSDVLLALVPLTLILVVIAPEEAAGGYIIPERLALIPALLLLLWLADQRAITRWLMPLLVVGAVLTVGLATMRVASYRQWSDDVDEVVSVASQVPPGSTLLPVTVLEYDGAPYFYRVEPTLYAVSWAAADHGVIGLSNLDADTDYAPARYRRGLDPYRDIDGTFSSHEGPPLAVDLDGLDAAGGSIDYVLVIGLDLDYPHSAATDEFLRDLDERYVLVTTSEPEHWARLYRRR